MKSITFILQSIIFWDKAHYTQNDNYALKDGAQRKMETQHKKLKIGPSQREVEIIHVIELFKLKTKVKPILRGACFCQRMVAKKFIITHAKKGF